MTRSEARSAGRDAVAVLGSFLVLGTVAGVVWWLVTDPAEFSPTSDGGGAMGESELAKRFAVDGWYSVSAAVAGFIGGLALTAWRSRDHRLTTLLLVPAAGLAAAVAALVGRLLGPDDPDAVLATAARGQGVPVELTVTAAACYLVWPIAALAGALMVLWSSPRSHETSPAQDEGAGGGSTVNSARVGR